LSTTKSQSKFQAVYDYDAVSWNGQIRFFARNREIRPTTQLLSPQAYESLGLPQAILVTVEAYEEE